MKQVEREMIYEINVVRKKPQIYIQYLQKDLKEAQDRIKNEGIGIKYYSLETMIQTIDGTTKQTTDTIWFNLFEEELNAIVSLINDLKGLNPLNILYPDQGIYRAATLYGDDEEKHQWALHHEGSDGSWPDARIKQYSPNMIHGSENIAGMFPEPTAREIVIQLLVDSGIKGYGHRYNILNPRWTNVACFCGGLNNGMYRWLQEFGEKEK
jgi:uncharacterized protein YkwD